MKVERSLILITWKNLIGKFTVVSSDSLLWSVVTVQCGQYCQSATVVSIDSVLLNDGY